MGLFGGKKKSRGGRSSRPARQRAPKRAAQQAAPTEEDAEGGGVRHCFLLLADDRPLDPAILEAAAKAEFGPDAHIDPGEKSEDSVTTMLVLPGLGLTFFGHMAAPIPEGEAEANADGNPFFPNGPQIVAQHQAHYIIGVMNGPSDPIESSVILTRLVQVALRAANDRALAVYWGNGSIVQSAEVFSQLSEGVSVDELPLHLWMRFQLYNDDSQAGVGLYTVGMNQFGLMEVEVPIVEYNAQDLFEFIFNTATYLIKSGPVVNDGDTIGGSETERIKVYHKPSSFDGMGEVYQIHMRA